MDLTEEVIDVYREDGTMAVIRKRPVTGHWPTIVMFHDGPGIRGATHDFAAKLARAGYEVVVPDLYWRHGRMIGYELSEREQDPSLVDHLWELLNSLTDEAIQADLDAALSATGLDHVEHLGTIGFCVGARAVFRTMIRLPERFVVGAMWHPSYLVDDELDSPHLKAHALRGGLFIGIGGDDRMQPESVHRPFLDAIEMLDHVGFEIYDGADHGYSWPGWPSYNANAATRSFNKTTALFHQFLHVT